MPKITFIQADDTEKVVEVEEGMSVMEAALQNDVEGILADCGGALACGTCHVYVQSDWVELAGERSEMEDSMLEMAVAPIDPVRSRLSCQIKITAKMDGLTVDVPENE